MNIAEFLADDFAALPLDVLRRCEPLRGTRLLLSGATGFFGKNLLAACAFLRQRGVAFHVTAMSRDPEQFVQQQPWCSELSWLNWIRGDVCEEWSAAGGYDWVVHAATATHAGSLSARSTLFSQVLKGTERALDFSATRSVRRLLLTGSGAQYGAIPSIYSAGIPESSAIACDPTLPASAYGEAKRAAETLAAIRAETSHFDVVNTRCFAFMGPGLPLDWHYAIGNFLADALNGRPIRLSSGGHAVRSYLYGADLAIWLLLLLLEAPAGACVNVGSNVGIRIADLAMRIRDIVNPGGEVLLGSSATVESRTHYLPCIDVAQRLHLKVWTGLDRAIERSAQWHRS